MEEIKMITIPCGGRPKYEMDKHMVETLMMQKKTMTVNEIAKFYNISKSTAERRLRRARELSEGEKTQS